ncbi:MAG: flavin reductase family protein [Planctomycetia bacterium]|nr:flavin reductase family protein [Planctomycetia bacterium]
MFEEIKDVAQLSRNPFQMIGQDWMLVSAAAGDRVNTMTASWGGLGVLWQKNVAFVFIRPQRYTREFVDAAETLSLCFLGEAQRKTLTYLGTTSGRDEDKIAKSGLHTLFCGETPYFEESELVFITKKLFVQRMDESAFLDKKIIEKWYPDHDFHFVYVCSIEKALQKTGKSE